MLRLLFAASIILTTGALADEAKAPQVDPNTVVTLTVEELQTLLRAEHDKAAADVVAAKIQSQIKAKSR